jgi:polyisoprenoid-binding protein YceI
MKRRLTIPLFLILSGIPLGAESPGAPVFEVASDGSKVSFFVKASVALTGDFQKWESTVKCASTDPTSCVLDLQVQAESVDTGSGMKDGKLKSKDFFDVKTNPVISFKSTKMVTLTPDSVEVDGMFTIRGVSKPEKLILTVTRGGAGGQVKGQMAFDRKEYGMTSGIPFIKIADRVEVNVDLNVKRVSGPPLEVKN